jgi:hypothetical protein
MQNDLTAETVRPTPAFSGAPRGATLALFQQAA